LVQRTVRVALWLEADPKLAGKEIQ
jgi:hypothetical protein